MEVLICILEFIQRNAYHIDDFCSELFSRLFILEAGGRKDFITEKGPVGLLFESHYLLHSIVKVRKLSRIGSQDLSQYWVLSLVEAGFGR